MGNYLIKSVVQEMLAEFPNMENFSSLSPIPGFKDWLVGEMSKYIHQHGKGKHGRGGGIQVLCNPFSGNFTHLVTLIRLKHASS